MKYLHAVLTVIAICLVVITFAVTGLIPTANARETSPRFVSVPVNPDGSITVKFEKGQTMDVNIDAINGSGLSGSKLPITGASIVDVNIEKVNGRSIGWGGSGSLPVNIVK
jgi:hypothetical protein